MIGKVEQRILEVLLEYFDEKLSINKVAALLNVSYPSIYTTTNNLLKQNFLLQEKIGNATICTLNLKNDVLRNMLSHISLLKRNNHAKKHATILTWASVLENLALTHSVSTSFLYDQKVWVCIQNPFEIESLQKKIQEQKKSLNGFSFQIITEKELLSHFPKSLTSKAILLYRPEQYFFLVSQHMQGEP